LANLRQRLLIEGQGVLSKKLSKTKLNKANKLVALEFQKIWQERTMAGIDVDGRRLPKLRKNYRKFKTDYIRGRRKLKRNSRTTKWKAKGVPNHGRLTGQLFSGTKFTPINASQSLTLVRNKLIVFGGVQVSVPNNYNKDKYEWLASNRGANKYKSYSKSKREIQPTLSRNPVTRRKEIERLKKVFLKATGLKTAKIKTG